MSCPCCKQLSLQSQSKHKVDKGKRDDTRSKITFPVRQILVTFSKHPRPYSKQVCGSTSPREIKSLISSQIWWWIICIKNAGIRICSFFLCCVFQTATYSSFLLFLSLSIFSQWKKQECFPITAADAFLWKIRRTQQN